MQILHSYLSALGIPIRPALAEQFNKFRLFSYKKGELLLVEGKIARSISFIVKGKVRHFYNIDGKEYTRWVSLENNFVTAFISFVRQIPSNENLECIENCELLSISRDEFYQLKADFPEIQTLWVQSLENEMIGYEERVRQLITTDSEKRYLDFLESYPLHAQQIPQKYIASMLGIEPRHLSRVRKKLAEGRK
ncbi:MAG: Crp/Fnr family transcriptional regulator [Saprospiraceae bacterium]